jgi:hypothetical protein
MKKNLFVAALVLPLIATTAFSSEYSILVDKDWSPYAGVAINRSLFNAYKDLDDRYLPSTENRKNLLWSAVRLSKVGIDIAFGSFLMVNQHEIFGHGYRGREFKINGLSYKVNFFSGSTYFNLNSFRGAHINRMSAFVAGGLEANSILADNISQDWFANQQIDHRDAASYMMNRIAKINYVYITRESDLGASNGNDVNYYITSVNSWYKGSVAPLTLGKMRSRMLWELLDLPLYYSLYSMGNYVYNGKPNVSMFMFDINGYKYLPTPRLLWAPWGTEWQVQNNILTPDKRYIQANIRYGKNSFINSYGIDLVIKPIWAYDQFEFGNKLNLWRQPQILVSDRASSALKKFGAAAYLTIDYKCNKNISVFSELGYKTSGFSQGDPLENSYVGRLGVKYNLVIDRHK